MRKLLSLIPVAVLLTACGSGDGDPGPAAAFAPQQSGTTTGTMEPDPLDNAPAGTPEDTEPSPVG